MIIAEKRRMELANSVKKILASANIPRTHFARVLCELLGLASAQGYRKLRGESDFTLPQIAVIEQHFGVKLLHADIKPAFHHLKNPVDWTPANFHIGSQNSKCHIILGGSLRDPARGPFAAYIDRGHWYVCLVETYQVNAPLFEVKNLAWSRRSAEEI